MKRKMNKLLSILILLSLLFLSSCDEFFNIEDIRQDINCKNLREGILNMNSGIVSREINELTAGLIPSSTPADPTGHRENFNTLIKRLNSRCGINAELTCYACIETYPPQSELLVSIDSSGRTISRIIDILTPDNAVLSCVRIHEYYQAEPFCFDSLSQEEIYNLITGKWEWTHSIIMQRNIPPPDNLITPEKEGYTIQHEFKADSSVNYYKNEQLTATYAYRIKRFKVLPEDEGYTTTININESSFRLHFTHPDSMMIGNGWLDGIDYYFSRKFH